MYWTGFLIKSAAWDLQYKERRYKLKTEGWEIRYRASVVPMNRRELQITLRILSHLLYFFFLSLILFFYVSPPLNVGYERQLSFYLKTRFYLSQYILVFLFLPFVMFLLISSIFQRTKNKMCSLQRDFLAKISRELCINIVKTVLLFQ